MLPRVLAALIVVVSIFGGNNALAQKSARIHVNPDQSRTVTYQEKGFTYHPARAITRYFSQSYQGYTQRRVERRWTGTYHRSYIKNWVKVLPAPRLLIRIEGKVSEEPADGVERSILIDRFT